MNKKLGYSIIGLQIFLLVMITVSTSYFIDEAYEKNPMMIIQKKEGIIKKMYRFAVMLLIGSGGLVSAETLAVHTCPLTKTGAICQEYTTADACKNDCNVTCSPTPRNEDARCKLGTCYDRIEGTCQPMSPKAACEQENGVWLDDENGNVQECRKGCCVLGERTFFATSQECTRKASVLGIQNKEFRPEISTELACLVLANSQEEGACTFEQDYETTCKFTTKSGCIEMRGEFHAGYLCSHPDLGTNCEKQKSAGCIEEKDEIFWFDSCGNRENIYDANKEKSYNSGKVMPKNESCALGVGTNPFANQKTCGNCFYLQGSRCGASTADEKLADTSQNAVCRDLSCKDDNGNVRLNGESWCAYQGVIGTQTGAGGFLRSVDTPGSRHFRQVCIDGEVRVDACADYRNEICVEAQSPIPNGKTFSSAACRINLWQQCLEYNSEVKNSKNPSGLSPEERDDKCEKNPDCFVKQVDLRSSKGNTFKFNMCAPKYPPGFDLASNGEGAENICGIATQKCTAVKVKKTSGWKWISNENCVKEGFAQQMNDFCMSLGDCGASVNYEGDLSESYGVTNSPRLNAAYLSIIKTYATIKAGQKPASPGNLTEFYGVLGIPDDLGAASGKATDPTKQISSVAMISGAAGIGLAYAATTYTGASMLGSLAATPGPWASGLGPVAGPQLSAAGGALAGAAIGFAVVALLIKFLGIGPGLDPAIAYGLMAAGAFAGAAIGASLMGGAGAGGLIGGLAALGPVGLIVLVVVIIIIVIMKLLGIGKTKKIVATFTCKPWQPPLGGSKCGECGKDAGNSLGDSKLPCSKYSCQALGQTCEYINEGTDSEACVDISPNDVTSPIIQPNYGILSLGYNYNNISDNGFKIKGPEECIGAYTPLVFGIELNEPGQCRIDAQHTNTFEEMEMDFGGRSLFIKNHTTLITIPSLESLGLPGYDPNRRADYNLYVRCQDKKGNKNVREYTINFCVKPGEDLTPPVIVAREPAIEYAKFNATELNASVIVNEPSECRWDSVDGDYSLMNKTLNCNTDLEDQELFGWRCSTVFPVSTDPNKTEENYFIRCKDQPWLVEDNGNGQSQIIVNEGTDEEGITSTRTVTLESAKKRNANTQGYRFVIKKSTALRIDSVTPNNQTLKFAVEPVSVSMEVRTSGGIDGKAECSYSLGGEYIPFRDTWKTVHTQVFQSFNSGGKAIPIRCEDLTGNTAEETARFIIEIDTTPPSISRVYEQGGNLIVITNEPADCYLSTSSCTFEIEDGTAMSGNDLVHSGSFERDLNNYIKCKDRSGNFPGRCSMTVRGGAI